MPPASYGAYVDLGYDQITYTAYQGLSAYSSPAGGVPARRLDHTGVNCPAVGSGVGLVAMFGTDALTGTNTNPSRFVARVYDTWSTNYESDGTYQFDPNNGTLVPGVAGGQSSNGFDDPDPTTGVGNGIVDNPSEQITSPPYPAPLRGIQVKIRIFEPDSRQIREVTIEQDFLPK